MTKPGWVDFLLLETGESSVHATDNIPFLVPTDFVAKLIFSLSSIFAFSLFIVFCLKVFKQIKVFLNIETESSWIT